MDFTKWDNQVNSQEMAKAIKEAKENAPQSDREVTAGEYVVKIEKMELGATKDGRPMFKVQCRIQDGEFKKWCIFMNRTIAGTKNDANMIASVEGWLEKLDVETDVTFKTYTQFSDVILDVFDEVEGYDFTAQYDPDAFNSISLEPIYD